MKQCRICGTDLEKDLFSYVAQKPTCCICTASFVGGDFSEARIEGVRKVLNLGPGEYLSERDTQLLAVGLLGRLHR
jgi:hypothetical protein